MNKLAYYARAREIQTHVNLNTRVFLRFIILDAHVYTPIPRTSPIYVRNRNTKLKPGGYYYFVYRRFFKGT